MRFLCLPGALTNAATLKVQMGPILDDLTSDSSATFFLTQGKVEKNPPSGYEQYFGQPPHFRFFRYDAGADPVDFVTGMCDSDDYDTPEEAIREFMSDESAPLKAEVRERLDDFYALIAAEGPFDGIVGYSEGASMAASLVVDEAKRAAAEGREPWFKVAVFFSGWPPLAPEGDSTILLADETGPLIDMQTVHVLGADDPFLNGGLALYNVCNPEKAEIFNFGRGHLIPRDARTVKELGVIVRRHIKTAEADVDR